MNSRTAPIARPGVRPLWSMLRAPSQVLWAVALHELEKPLRPSGLNPVSLGCTISITPRTQRRREQSSNGCGLPFETRLDDRGLVRAGAAGP